MPQRTHTLVEKTSTQTMTYNFEADELTPAENIINGIVKVTINGDNNQTIFHGTFTANFESNRVKFIRGRREDLYSDGTLVQAGTFNEFNVIDSYFVDKNNPTICEKRQYNMNKKIVMKVKGLFVNGNIVEGEESKYVDDFKGSKWKELHYTGKFSRDNNLEKTHLLRYEDPNSIVIGVYFNDDILVTRGYLSQGLRQPSFLVSIEDKKIISISLRPTMVPQCIWQAQFHEPTNRFIIEYDYAEALDANVIKEHLSYVISALQKANFILPLNEQAIMVEIKKNAAGVEKEKNFLFAPDCSFSLVQGSLDPLGLLSGDVKMHAKIRQLGVELTVDIDANFVLHNITKGTISYTNHFINKLLYITNDENWSARLVIEDKIAAEKIEVLFSLKGLIWQNIMSDDWPDDVFIKQTVTNAIGRDYYIYRGYLRQNKHHGEGELTIQTYKDSGETTILFKGIFEDGLLGKGESVTVMHTNGILKRITVITLDERATSVIGNKISFMGHGNSTTTFKDGRIYTEAITGTFIEDRLVTGNVTRKYSNGMFVCSTGSFNEKGELDSGVDEADREFHDDKGILVATQKGRFKEGFFCSGIQISFNGDVTEYYCGRASKPETAFSPNESLKIIYNDPAGVLISHNKKTKTITLQKNFRYGKAEMPLHQIVYSNKNKIIKVSLPGEWCITCNDNGNEDFKALKKIGSAKEKTIFENKAREVFDAIKTKLTELNIIKSEAISKDDLLTEDAKEKQTAAMERRARKEKEKNATEEAAKNAQRKQDLKNSKKALEKQKEQQEKEAKVAVQQALEAAVHERAISLAEELPNNEQALKKSHEEDKAAVVVEEAPLAMPTISDSYSAEKFRGDLISHTLVEKTDTQTITYNFEAGALIPSETIINSVVRVAIAGNNTRIVFHGTFTASFESNSVKFIRGKREDFYSDDNMLVQEGTFNDGNVIDSYAVGKKNPTICEKRQYCLNKIVVDAKGLFVNGNIIEGEESKYGYDPKLSKCKEIYYRGKFCDDGSVLKSNSSRYEDPEGMLIRIYFGGEVFITKGFFEDGFRSLTFLVSIVDKKIASVSLQPRSLDFIWQAQFNKPNRFTVEYDYAEVLDANVIKKHLSYVIKELSERKLILPFNAQEIMVEIKQNAAGVEKEKKFLFAPDCSFSLVQGNLDPLGLLCGDVKMHAKLGPSGREESADIDAHFVLHELVYGEVSYSGQNPTKKLIVSKDKNQLARLVVEDKVSANIVSTLFSMKDLRWQNIMHEVIPEHVFVEQTFTKAISKDYGKYRGYLRQNKYHGEGELTSKTYNESGETTILFKGIFEDGLLGKGGTMTVAHTNNNNLEQIKAITLDEKATLVGDNKISFMGHGNSTAIFKDKRIYAEEITGKFIEDRLVTGKVTCKYSDGMFVCSTGSFNENGELDSGVDEAYREFHDDKGILIATQKGRFKEGLFCSGIQISFNGDVTEYYCGKVSRAETAVSPNESLKIIYNDQAGVLISHNKKTKTITLQKNFHYGKAEMPLHQIVYGNKNKIIKVSLPGEWCITCNDNGNEYFKALKKIGSAKEKTIFENKAREVFDAIKTKLTELNIIKSEAISKDDLLTEDAKEKQTAAMERRARKEKEKNAAEEAAKNAQRKQDLKNSKKALEKQKKLQEKEAKVASQQEHEATIHKIAMLQVEELKNNAQDLKKSHEEDEEDKEDLLFSESSPDKDSAVIVETAPLAVAAELAPTTTIIRIENPDDGFLHEIFKCEYTNAAEEFIYKVRDNNISTGLCFEYMVSTSDKLAKGKYFTGSAALTIIRTDTKITIFHYILNGDFLCTADCQDTLFQKPNFQLHNGKLVRFHDGKTSIVTYKDAKPVSDMLPSIFCGFFNTRLSEKTSPPHPCGEDLPIVNGIGGR